MVKKLKKIKLNIKMLQDPSGKTSWKRCCSLICLLNAIALSWFVPENVTLISIFLGGAITGGITTLKEHKK
jgi:hypothetical protein